jgi:MFS family permease
MNQSPSGLEPPGAADAPEQRRTLATLVIAQLLSGAGLAAGITVGALLAQEVIGTTSAAGLPATFFTLGSAAAAIGVGRVSQRAGRRAGLTLGYATGAIGSGGVVLAAVAGTATGLFLALFVYGAGFATNLQARYAGADLASPARHARAVSTVLVATTLGAVVGPNLVTPTGRLASSWGLPALAGPFMLAAVAYGSAAMVLWLRLRPDPLLLARARAAGDAAAAHAPIASREGQPVTAAPAAGTPAAPSGAPPAGPPAPSSGSRTPSPAVRRTPGLALGASVMLVATVVMTAIMTMTPVHMADTGHTLAAAGVVIAVHVGFMFLPAPVSGWLVDRYGARLVAGLSAFTLLAAGVVAASAPAPSVVVLGIGLALLGLGWSFGLVSGTAIVTAAVPLERRAATQGNVDVLLALAGASGGALSGMVVASTGYSALALGGAGLALALAPFVVARSRVREVAA